MELDKVFFYLRKKGKISRNKLYEYGLDDEYINNLVDDNLLYSIDDEFYKVSYVDELVDFGRFLIKEKDYTAANSIFLCCYTVEPTNFNANIQLFYRNLIQKNTDYVFKHFNVVYKHLIENNKAYDANYYLYLLGNIYGVPSIYKHKFDSIKEEDILIPKVDGPSVYENIFRKEIFSNSYFKVNNMFDERFSYDEKNDMPFEDSLEKELILKWLVKNRNFNKMLISYINEDKVEEVKSILEKEKENRFLTTTNKYLLKVVNKYFEIKKTGIIPEITYDGDNVFEAIDGANYGLAVALIKKHQESLRLEKDSYLSIMIQKLITLINKKKIENEKEKENKDITILIDALKEVRKKDDKLKPLIDAVNEMRNENKYTLTKSEKDSLDSKIRELRNGKSLFLLDPMPKDKRAAIHEYIKTQDDIAVFNIDKDEKRRVVLRYKPFIKEYVNIPDTAKKARRCYANQKYEEAAMYYELLLKIGKPRDITYGGYGLTLLKLHRKKEAIECLKIATIISKDNDRSLDYSDLIADLENVVKDEDKKPKVKISEKDFSDDNKKEIDENLINDIIALSQEGEISLIDACNKLGLVEDEINYIKLLYARDCYYLGRVDEGDIYFRQVEKSKNKSKKVKDLYKKIQLDKKYYPSRLDEEKNQLIFIKK